MFYLLLRLLNEELIQSVDKLLSAAKQIYELGKDLGPVIVSTAAYRFFKGSLGL